MEQLPELTETSPRERYFSLPKTVGEVSSVELLSIVEELVENQDHTSIRASILHNSIASSAIIEAVLITEDTSHRYDDERIEGIELAEGYLRDAYDAQYRQIEAGFDPPSEKELLRMSLRFDFMRVYKDMICGEITNDTQMEIRENLDKHIRSYNQLLDYEYTDHDERRSISGLKAEATILMKYWQKYPNDSRLVAIPATLRGDNGNKRSSETHDIILFEETTPGSFTYARSSEVKSGRAMRKKLGMLARYIHPITNINVKTGKIQEF